MGEYAESRPANLVPELAYRRQRSGKTALNEWLLSEASIGNPRVRLWALAELPAVR